MQMMGRRSGLAGVFAGISDITTTNSLFRLAGTSWINLIRLRTKLCSVNFRQSSYRVAHGIPAPARAINLINDHASRLSVRRQPAPRLDCILDSGRDCRRRSVIRRIDLERLVSRLPGHNVREGCLSVPRRPS